MHNICPTEWTDSQRSISANIGKAACAATLESGQLSTEVARAKARAIDAWTESVQRSYANMRPFMKVIYSFKIWSNSVRKDYEDQWLKEPRHNDAGWDWVAISEHHKEIKDVTVALYVEGALCALALFRASKSRVLVRFLEGDPRPDCHIKGSRALLMLDLAATYGQRLGRSELHLQPVNEDLAEHYRSRFGFTDGKDGNGQPVLKRFLI